MMEKKGNRKVRIVCPICGKPTNVSIVHLNGTLRYGLRCRSCKGESEVEIKDIQ
jgi:formate dehydrogenase maturation protein FdhE